MILRKLLILHGVVTFVAAIVLVIAPELIPKTVGINLDKSAYLLSYFLGAAEFGIAYLSFFAARLKNIEALRLICASFIVFHLATAVLEIYALAQGVNTAILANVALRIIISVLFGYFGLLKLTK